MPLVLFFLLVCANLAADSALFKFHSTFTLVQEGGEYRLEVAGEQDVEAECRLESGKLFFSLKRLKVSLSNNGEKVLFDTNEPESSFYFSQAQSLLGKEIAIPLSKEGELDFSSSGLDVLKNMMPALQEMDPTQFLADLLNPILAVFDREMKVGQRRERGGVVYEVTAVEGDRVEFELHGVIEPKVVALPGGFSLSLSGSVVGAGQKKSGALEGEWTVERVTRGSLKFGESEWSLSASVKTEGSAAPMLSRD